MLPTPRCFATVFVCQFCIESRTSFLTCTDILLRCVAPQFELPFRSLRNLRNSYIMTASVVRRSLRAQLQASNPPTDPGQISSIVASVDSETLEEIKTQFCDPGAIDEPTYASLRARLDAESITADDPYPRGAASSISSVESSQHALLSRLTRKDSNSETSSAGSSLVFGGNGRGNRRGPVEPTSSSSVLSEGLLSKRMPVVGRGRVHRRGSSSTEPVSSPPVLSDAVCGVVRRRLRPAVSGRGLLRQNSPSEPALSSRVFSDDVLHRSRLFDETVSTAEDESMFSDSILKFDEMEPSSFLDVDPPSFLSAEGHQRETLEELTGFGLADMTDQPEWEKQASLGNFKFFPHPVLAIRGACVTMRGGNFVFGAEGEEKVLPASAEAIKSREAWLVESRRKDRLADARMRKQGRSRPLIIRDEGPPAAEHYFPPVLPRDQATLFKEVVNAEAGEYIDDFLELTVATNYLGLGEAPKRPGSVSFLKDMDLPAKIKVNCEEMKFDELLPIQREVIPLIRANFDIIGTSPTGTGKTAAFLIPIIASIVLEQAKNPLVKVPRPRALILVPTRELACQIQKTAVQIAFDTGVTCLAVYGAIDSEYIQQRLSAGYDIIVGTPGRVLDVIQRKLLNVASVRFVVVDEVDQMLLSRSFPEVTSILDSYAFPSVDQRQTMFFSATIPAYQLTFLTRHQWKPFSVRIGKDGPLATIEQAFEKTRGFHERVQALQRIVEKGEGEKKTVIVFARGKDTVCSLGQKLQEYNPAVTHSGFRQEEREKELLRFTGGSTSVLVTTDLSSRGLDIAKVKLIINFDLPKNVEGYIHRVGRSGRKGHAGSAISFYDPMRRDDKQFIGPLVALLKSCGIHFDQWLEEEASRVASGDTSLYHQWCTNEKDDDLADMNKFPCIRTIAPLLERFEWSII